jgi:hypothetical protein
MTKKLEELFNLPKIESDQGDAPPTNEELADHIDTIHAIDDAIDKIDAALPTVRDLEAADAEMDDLAKLAQDKFDDLMDLGMNVEARYAGAIFQTAGVLLGHAITAKQAKLDKKLRMVDLQLKKARLDSMEKKTADPAAAAADGHGVVLDRNALLAQILSQNKKA